MKTKIVIIGLGNIGKRHMQAALALDRVTEIVCYDVNQEALDTLEVFGRDNSLDITRVKLEPSWEKVLRHITPEVIVIIATTAQGRISLLQAVIGLHPMAVICEKPVCQSLDEYDEIIQFTDSHKVAVYCNFPRHMYKFYREIKSFLQGPKEYYGHAIFERGMACVGIHFLELFVWLSDAKEYKIDEARFYNVHEIKRKGFFDFYGSLVVTLNQGIRCMVIASEDHKVTSVGIMTKTKEYRVFEAAGQMVVCDYPAQVSVQAIDALPTSRLTDVAITEILGQGPVGLPSLQQVYLAHKILFEAMEINGLQKLNIT